MLYKLFVYGVCFTCFVALLACSSTPPPKDPNARPTWVDAPGEGMVVGGASYSIFGKLKARQDAVMKAFSSLALSKGAKVDVIGKVENDLRSSLGNSGESIRQNASIQTTAVIEGKEVSIAGKIKKFWIDKSDQTVWVLIEETKPGGE